MDAITEPVRIIPDPRTKGYRLKTWLATSGVFILMAADGVRAAVGWWGWFIVFAIVWLPAIILLARSNLRRLFGQLPLSLIGLHALMLLSLLWSAYQFYTFRVLGLQFGLTIFALFLTVRFDWRELLRIFANVIRVVLGGSLILELYAALSHQKISPLVFDQAVGATAPSYYWSEGNLFNGERIQGIVANANTLAAIAMVGVILFAVEQMIFGVSRWLSWVSLSMAIATVALTKSAGIGFALITVILAAIVSFAAEGKDRETRHRYYRLALTGSGIVLFFILVYRNEVFTFIGKSPDMTGRSGIWKNVLGLVAEKPIQGWGWVSYWIPGVKPFKGLGIVHGVEYYQAHNAYIEMFFQLGAIGLALFLALLLVAFVKIWRLAVRHTNALYLWPILLFVGLLAQNVSESRMLVEIGWVYIVLLTVKVNEPVDALEPIGRSTKRQKLIPKPLRRFIKKSKG
jgi:O-antigen ligase